MAGKGQAAKQIDYELSASTFGPELLAEVWELCPVLCSNCVDPAERAREWEAFALSDDGKKFPW